MSQPIVSLTLTAKGLVKIQIGSPSETTLQRSKLTFLKSRLLATFNYKMVARKKILVAQKKINNNCNIQGRTLRVRYMMFYYSERHVCNPFLCQIVSFSRLPIKTL